MRLYWIGMRAKSNDSCLYGKRRRGSQGRRPRGDGDRDWSEVAFKPRNGKDGRVPSEVRISAGLWPSDTLILDPSPLGL